MPSAMVLHHANSCVAYSSTRPLSFRSCYREESESSYSASTPFFAAESLSRRVLQLRCDALR